MNSFPLNSFEFSLNSEYESGEKGATEALPSDLDIEDGVIEIRKDIVWGEKEVQSQNWLMLQLSQDLVVGESKAILEKAIGSTLAGH